LDRRDADVEIVAIEPPDRLHGLHERPVRTMKAFIGGVVPAMLPLLDRPYACFGPYLGGLAGFEAAEERLARMLRPRVAPQSLPEPLRAA
jgi:surfactin synthase thioesterase subunit